ncbi:FAD/NAD-P-binding domain-containing protein [Thelephora terrestris]|uniref:Kynurenine 3-monooxygenase n=1 Tax=Thelephora terrestris TaxID=56493 RepID=A0A9P6HRV0_9AGAM|nr:FAD/NAD-P-binding domain-containing protein [Thelephora terrestris]
MEISAQNGYANRHENGEANGHGGSYFPEAIGQTRQRKAVIVGAGPVGCFAAIALANKGWSVDLYEGRADKRLRKSEEGQRSINLVLSSRGLAALYAIDPCLEERLMKQTIPIHSRMIHMKDGSSSGLQYDPHKQTINSISRSLLNEKLMEEALLVPNIRFFFEHKPQTIDFDRRVLNVHDVTADTMKQVGFDLCVGADGSHSFVRRQIMRVTRMDYQQEYIPHEYMELKMPAACDEDGNLTFALDPNHLHIWPRHSFMLMGLPNQDKSFTCTLFAPTADFARITRPALFVRWMEEHFPDAVPLIGERELADMWVTNPRGALITVKATPYHYKDRGIILGDAAHSQVPFYGQGLNCGLEDVRVLDHLLRECKVAPVVELKGSDKTQEDEKMAAALTKYTQTRHEDLVAICDMAMRQYIEMRHDVTTLSFRLRKKIDNLLYKWGGKEPETLRSLGPQFHKDVYPSAQPRGWMPLYTMVTFRPDVGYAAVKTKAERQTRILNAIGIGAGFFGVVSVVGLAYHRLHGRRW